MPRSYDDIQDKNDSIVRPVGMDVARQLGQILKLPGEFTVLFPGLWEEGINTGATINTPPDADPARFKYGQRLRIEVTEKPVEDRILAIAAHRMDTRPFFRDEALGITLFPVVVGTQMEFSLTYRASSRADAVRFRDDILVKFSEGRTDFLHEIRYHWSVPDRIMHLLHDIYTLREARAGYGDTFSDYISNHITPRATNIANLIGTETKVAIRELQTRTLGAFDFIGTVEPGTKDREGRTINIEMRYVFNYDQVVGVTSEYPLMVHGQMIDEKWYGTPRASGYLTLPERRLRDPGFSRDYFNQVTGQNPNWDRLQFDVVKIPNFDDWSADYVKPNVTELYQAACAGDGIEMQRLFGFDDVEEFDVDEDVKLFLKKEHEYACKYKESIFYCMLYEDLNPMDDGILMLDENLTFFATKPLDPRKRYHVVVAFNTNLSALSPTVKMRMRKNGVATKKILCWMQSKLKGHAYCPELLRGGIFDIQDLEIVSDILEGRKPRGKYEYDRRGVMLTVGSFTIVTKRGR